MVKRSPVMGTAGMLQPKTQETVPAVDFVPSRGHISVRQASLIAGTTGWLSFVGGAALTGQLAVAAGGAVMGLFSLVVGIFIVAPLGGRYAAERFMGILEDASPEARSRKQTVVLSLATETYSLIQAEKALPAHQRPLHAAAASLMEVLGDEGEEAIQGLEGSVGRLQKRYQSIGGGSGDMMAEVKMLQREGAIDEKTAGTLQKVAIAEKIFSRFTAWSEQRERRRVDGGRGQLSLPAENRRRPPQEGVRGYGP